MMLADVQKIEAGYLARFHRPLNHSVEEVWVALTENRRLEKWMPNLQVEELRVNGIIKFDMKDGSGVFINIEITDLQPYAVLEFIWGTDQVRFELEPTPEGCLLVLIESIRTITEHTPKDLTGWHVCLDVLSALLDGQEMDFPKADWEQWYQKYILLIAQLQ